MPALDLTPRPPTGIPVMDAVGGRLMHPLTYALLDAHGEAFTDPVPPDRPLRSAPKACFQNACLDARRHEDLAYVEGYAFAPVVAMPVCHAWLVDEAGRIYDATWEQPGTDYFGVAFPLEVLDRVALLTGLYGVLDSTWQHDVGRYLVDRFNLSYDL